MERTKRTERLGVISEILVSSPNTLHRLNEFVDLFGVAKSTISEDVDILAASISTHGCGRIETVPGAAGGVKYMPYMSQAVSARIVKEVAEKLSQPGRLLPGGFLYSSDIASDPKITKSLAAIIASRYLDDRPDFILTMETKGIPLALMTASALEARCVIARRDSKAYEGSAVKINYTSGSDNAKIDTMAISKRAVKPGDKALIVDDFAKGGGTLQGMADMMKECQIEVLGIEVMISTRKPIVKQCPDFSTIMWLNGFDRLTNSCDVVPDVRFLQLT